ncbi:MAG: TIGR02679 family protein [Burkholderiales bacterium]|nr:TIGR02679 family protein [Burkholderiales bacterium]MDE1928940.1 TIGR02679 family protein [Burkholderiales bacterium]MDE2159699.1 TIGR02679 family protein [Burkholderiales bacterium]MDE2502554.1 TIGR02679 family protein [Burkholderiales bacterium]
MGDPRLQRLLGGDALAGLRARLRAAFERVAPDATPPPLRLTGLAVHEREALAALAARPPRVAASIRVDLVEAGARLAAAGLARNLRDALEQLDGPIRAVTAEREVRLAAWSALVDDEADAALRNWLAAPAGRGLLKRLAGGDATQAASLLTQARAVLSALPAPGWPRARLAAQTLGDAHALDDGQPAATLVLAALRHRREGEPDDDDESRRARWAAVGVSVNELARPALALNLRVADGEPVFYSLRRLLRAPLVESMQGRKVYVCENPNLVAIAADALGARCAPLVCTDGMPAAAQRTLLAQLARAGAELRYHGDFDWAGIAIANQVLRACGARPWHMEAADYESALAARTGIAAALTGTPVAPSWSMELGATMQHARQALAEEAVAGPLLIDLEVA